VVVREHDSDRHWLQPTLDQRRELREHCHERRQP
jgi:hypothetical protein